MKDYRTMTVCLCVLLAGCTAQKTLSGTAAPAEEAASVKTSAAEEARDKSVTENGKITPEDAKKTALAHAGVEEADVNFVKCEPDYENGVKVYDIEFWSGDTEYDYEIDAVTGEIVSFDKDIESFRIPESNASGTQITEEQALETALQKAGLNEEEISHLKIKLDDEHGVQVYEIEFKSSGMEYEFEINASTGEILKYESERD